jgi:hypothetical protein
VTSWMPLWDDWNWILYVPYMGVIYTIVRQQPETEVRSEGAVATKGKVILHNSQGKCCGRREATNSL